MLRFLVVPILVLHSTAASAQPDLSATFPIIDERFERPLDRYDGRSGVWTTIGRTGRLMTNATEAVFLDHGVLGEAADKRLPPLHVITEDGLSLRSAALPADLLPPLRAYMEATGQGKRAADVRYAVGKITTAQTWSQTYGYFEIEARMPRGKGRWPAFWLTFAGRGWPPEIDVLEAFGAGLDSPTPKDDTFNTAVYFDALDADGQPTLETDFVNPFARDAEARAPDVKQRGNRSIYSFQQLIAADAEFGANIYDDFHVYAALWTPETIHFYFGTSRETLREVYRTPTPPDAQVPMYIIANDQFTAGFWQPRADAIDRVLDPENDFRIRRIVVRGLEPDLGIDMGAGETPFDDRSSRIADTAGNDVIAPGEGFDLIDLSGGADQLYLERGRDQKIVSGFGADDTVELVGYPFADSKDILSRLTQVGADVWLPSGADPFWPHTIVFRDSTVGDFEAGQFRNRWPVAGDFPAGQPVRVSQPQGGADGDQTSAAPGGTYRDEGEPVHMVGSPGPERYIVANRASVIDEPANGGVDTLFTWVPFALPENVERGVVRGRGVVLSGTAGDDRLETESEGATLAGGPGDDFYVIDETAAATTIRIGFDRGHDRIRGLGAGDRLELDPDLLAGRANWRFDRANGAFRVRFSEDQSVSLEGMDLAGFNALIKPE